MVSPQGRARFAPSGTKYCGWDTRTKVRRYTSSDSKQYFKNEILEESGVGIEFTSALLCKTGFLCK